MRLEWFVTFESKWTKFFFNLGGKLDKIFGNLFIMSSGSFIDWKLSAIAGVAKLIVCITGMPGAGKSTIADALKSKGFDKITMGDAVRAEAVLRKIEPTSANLGKLMLE